MVNNDPTGPGPGRRPRSASTSLLLRSSDPPRAPAPRCHSSCSSSCRPRLASSVTIASCVFLLLVSWMPVVFTFTAPGHSFSWKRRQVLSTPPIPATALSERGSRPVVLPSLLMASQYIDEEGHHHHERRTSRKSKDKSKDEAAANALLQQFRRASSSSSSSPSSITGRLNLGFHGLKDTFFSSTTSGIPVQQSSSSSSSSSSSPPPSPKINTANIVLMAGFEAFNIQLYRQAARTLSSLHPSLTLTVFTDRDISTQPEVVSAALAEADVFFGSLIFDYDQVNWLRTRIENIKTRLVFESALELMSFTRVGSFTMGGEGGKEGGPGAQKGGPPPVVKALLSKFGSKKEEDRLKGYLSFLKIGPTILKLVPGKKAMDVRTWLEVYSYWNQGGVSNVVSLFLLLAQRFSLLGEEAVAPLEVVETPGQGLIHPLTSEIFQSPRLYLQWYLRRAALGQKEDGMVPPSLLETAPRVAVLLYRKHVITNQFYINQLIRIFEKEGLVPIPVFINGVEGHTIVRDLLTTQYEQAQRRQGICVIDSLSSEAVEVDAVVNTIGFPLVGGPAGSMEGGRRIDVATRLLAAKNIPLLVAAPLLLQEIRSWREKGVLGLQSAVLYSLPELDGAVDTVVLGGLVGDKIALVPERVRKLARRIKGWHAVRVTPKKEKRIGILCYGFPPNVGAIGTAALLNVPKSLEKLLVALQEEGYDTGLDARKIDGESVIAILTAINQEAVVAGGPSKMHAMVDTGTFGKAEDREGTEGGGGFLKARVTAEGVTPGVLRQAVGERTTRRIEKMWGELEGYIGLFTSQAGELVVGGVQLGNVWIGIQPLLGIEGDPMRLLFERDLTPHPQYVAFYEWMKREFKAQAVVHFGMHGTVEWLPGSPLGNTATTWPDILLGEIPNLYLYACNNPSESILAKRRGYGTIVSHNVPPYSRAGLYKDLAELRELLSEYRENSQGNAGLRPVIAGVLERTGLWGDCPWPSSFPSSSSSSLPSSSEKQAGRQQVEREGSLTVEEAEVVDPDLFDAYTGILSSYLGVLEQRLFSEGLHVLGQRPTPSQLLQYLDAYFEGDPSLPPSLLRAVVGMETPLEVEGKVLLGRLLQRLRSSSSSSLFSLSSSSSPPYVLEEEEEDWGEGGKEGVLRALEGGERAPARHWYNSLSKEEQYALTLFRPVDLIRFYSLQIKRALGDAEARKRLEEEVAVAWGTLEETERKEEGAKEGGVKDKVVEALEIKRLLEQNTDELSSLLKGLSGQYILPGVGGDLLRDGRGVLPTGRNIHALDPYRLPSPGAWARGQEAVRKILEQHKEGRGEGGAEWPETVAVMLWGLDVIKTRGESVAILLALVGARPVKEATGRVVRYELVPLKELGRPRIDVLASLSGIFRDSFSNVVDLLDDLFERAAEAEGESEEENYIKKHARKLQAQGEERPTARLFSNPAGDFGSLVNERVGSGEWEQEEELGETWAGRNSFSFGKGERERGVRREGVLRELLATTGRIVQEIDSVEYGMTDIQEYYANTGALKKAAENVANSPERIAEEEAEEKENTRREDAQSFSSSTTTTQAQPHPPFPSTTSTLGGKRPKRVVPVSIIEAFTKEVAPQSLESVLRLEYRSKLLNPKWAKAMAAQGSGGAYEISQRMTALVGWSSTAGFKDKFVYDGVCERYVQDEEMAKTLMENNPEAFRNVVKRMLEANGRGYWEAGPEVLELLKELYAEAEDEIELSGGKGVRKKVLREQESEKEGGVVKRLAAEKTPVSM